MATKYITVELTEDQINDIVKTYEFYISTANLKIPKSDEISFKYRLVRKVFRALQDSKS